MDDDEDCNVVVNDEDSGSDGEADVVDDEDDDGEGQLSSNGSSDSTPRDDEFDNLSIENDICLRDSQYRNQPSNTEVPRRQDQDDDADFEDNFILHSEEVKDERCSENSPNKNMRHMGRIGFSSIGSYSNMLRTD